MIGTIICAVGFLLVGLAVAYFNTGFLATMVIAVAFLGMVFLLINFLEKREKNKTNKNFGPTVFFSSKALRFSDRIGIEFRGLVSEIATHQARLDGKECTTDGCSELPEEKLISEKNMEDAFQRAVAEIRIGNSDCESCDSSLLDRIKNLRKKYEVKTP